MINDQGVYSQDGFIIVGIHYLGSEIIFLCVLKLFIDVLFTMFGKDLKSHNSLQLIIVQ